MKRYDNNVCFFLNDNSNCFNDEKKFDLTQSKYICMSFAEINKSPFYLAQTDNRSTGTLQSEN